MLLSHHQNVGQNRDIKIANRLFENVSQLKYLGTTVTNQNLIQEEIKRSVGTSHMSDIWQMSVVMQQFVDFISMVTRSPLLCYATNAKTC
jgi:hypothetical protein